MTLAATKRKLDEMDSLADHRKTIVNLGWAAPSRSNEAGQQQ